MSCQGPSHCAPILEQALDYSSFAQASANVRFNNFLEHICVLSISDAINGLHPTWVGLEFNDFVQKDSRVGSLSWSATTLIEVLQSNPDQPSAQVHTSGAVQLPPLAQHSNPDQQVPQANLCKMGHKALYTDWNSTVTASPACLARRGLRIDVHKHRLYANTVTCIL